MASSINASTSGAGGVITTADSSGVLNIQTAGNTAVTVDASQNVGIGTASPDSGARTTISSSTNTPLYAISSDVNSYIYFKDSGSSAYQVAVGSNSNAMKFVTGGSERMRITSSGNVGIGTSSPSAKLQVSDGTTTLDLNPTGGVVYFGTSTNHTMIFSTNNSERMRIANSGQLYINTTTQLGNTLQKMALKYDGSVEWGLSFQNAYSGNAGSAINFCNYAGTQVGTIQPGASSTSYVTSSDYRLKENVQPMTGALDKVALLKPVTYTWKESGEEGQGFIAHELQAVVPDCVTGEKDAVAEDGSIKPQGVDTSFLVATLTAAIQEMKAIIDAQSARITALENK